MSKGQTSPSHPRSTRAVDTEPSRSTRAGLLLSTALLVGILWWLTNGAGRQAPEVRPLTQEELASPELRAGIEKVLASPQAPAPESAVEAPVDYSGLPFERPSPTPVDDPAVPLDLGPATVDFLRENHHAAVEEVIIKQEQLRDAEEAGDAEAIAAATRDLDASRLRAEHLQHELEVRTNEEP